MKNLKNLFILFFIAITIPSGVLIWRVWQQLETESQLFATEKAASLIQIVNKKIAANIETENNRSFLHYRFIISTRMGSEEKITLSPLSEYPTKSAFSGLVGYFQIDPDSSIHTPLVPEGPLANLEFPYRQERLSTKQKIETLIRQSDLIFKTQKKPSIHDSTEFLNESSIERLIFEQKIPTPRYELFTQKKDIVFNVENTLSKKRNKSDGKQYKTNPLMEVEVHPLQASSINDYVIFYRTVNRNGEHYIQGFVVHLPTYFDSIAEELRLLNTNEPFGAKLFFKEIEVWKWRLPPLWKKEYNFNLVAPLPFAMSIIYHSEGLPTGGEAVLFLGFIFFLISIGGLGAIYKATLLQVESTRKRSDFISAVSHELKTPLTSIRMYSEMLESGFVSTEEQKMKYYNKITAESNRLTRLIQNVLDLSKMERNQWRVSLQSYNIQNLIKNFSSHTQALMHEKGFQLELHLHPTDTAHKIDKDAMHQILLNVVENSAKFSYDCEPKKIVISTVPQADRLVLSIRDYGPGVPPHEIEKIFSVFYRIEREMVRKTNGTGIGLSLVKNLCDMMNIQIEVRNMNPGLIMIFYIPYDEL